MAAPDPHCSKCCPIKPPVPAPPWIAPWGVYLWLGLIGAAVLGGWWLVTWAGSSIWP